MKAVHHHGRDGARVLWEFAPTDFCNLRSAFFFGLDFRAREIEGK